jgi:tetratricopeptide (TPR) repeat protein
MADSIYNISSNPQQLISLSYTYYINNFFEKGIKACEKALKYDPNNADAYNNMCSCYNSLKMWAKAEEACNKALAIKPDHELAKNNLNWAKQNHETEK